MLKLPSTSDLDCFIKPSMKFTGFMNVAMAVLLSSIAYINAIYLH